MDSRTLREKLMAMAERGTEHERAVAQAKLEAMGASPPPPPPPTRNGAAFPDDDAWLHWKAQFGFSYSSSGTNVSFTTRSVRITDA